MVVVFYCKILKSKALDLHLPWNYIILVMGISGRFLQASLNELIDSSMCGPFLT